VEAVNRLVFRLRFFWLARLRRRLRVHESLEGVIRPEYSIGMLRRGVTSDRPLRLIRPLSVLDALDKRSARVLSVGCRFETELLYLLGYGFRRVRGLDLVAYSPWVDVGNMHGMPYEDDSWDAVILGWVLSYSETPEQAAREIVRVTRNGGVVAVAVAQYPRARLEEFAARGDPMAGADRIQTVEAILSLFDGHVGRVYFSHDAPAAEVESYCGVVFSIRK
jgi:SAM-dependent methyltransferase